MIEDNYRYWISVDYLMPQHGKNVLVSYVNELGSRRYVVGHYIERWTEESLHDDGVNDEYSDENETYYLKEGWYENLQNWDEYSSIAIHEGEVDYWMSLPLLHGG